MASAPNKSHSSGPINSPPIGFGTFHAVIYSPFNKFPPLSFTCSVPPFCHLMMCLARRGLSRKKSKTWLRDVGVDPRGHVGFSGLFFRPKPGAGLSLTLGGNWAGAQLLPAPSLWQESLAARMKAQMSGCPLGS